MKQIVFLVNDFGVDGRGPKSIRFASLDEKERDDWCEESPDKPWLSTEDIVSDLDIVALNTWKKLNGLEKLSLLQTSAPMWQKDFKE